MTNHKITRTFTRNKSITSMSIEELFNYEFPLVRFRNKILRDSNYKKTLNLLLGGMNMCIDENKIKFEYNTEDSGNLVERQIDSIISHIGGYTCPIDIVDPNIKDNPQSVSCIIKKRPNMMKSRLRDLERIINCNFKPGRSSFLTLTYRDLVFNDKLSSKYTQYFFTSLMNWYKKNYPNSPKFRYISMKDLQKNGSIHHHICLFDVEFIPIEVLQKFWKKRGNVFIEEMRFFTIKPEVIHNLIDGEYGHMIYTYDLHRSFTYGKLYESFKRDGKDTSKIKEFLKYCKEIEVFDMGHYIVKYCFKYIKKNDSENLYYIDQIYTPSLNCKRPVIIRNYSHDRIDDFDKYLEERNKEFELQKSTGQLVDGKKILSQGVYDIKDIDPVTGEERINRVFHRKFITNDSIKKFREEKKKNTLQKKRKNSKKVKNE